MNDLKQKIDTKWLGRSGVIVFCDVLIIMAAYLGALLLRFDFVFSAIPQNFIDGYMWSMPYWVIVTVVVFYGFKLYHSIWSFASMMELRRMVGAYVVLMLAYVAGGMFMGLHMPKSYYFMGYVMAFGLHTCIRFSYRWLRYLIHKRAQAEREETGSRIMVIGGGAAGRVIIRELQSSNHLDSKVCCIIDDNKSKVGRLLEGVPIVGGREDIISKVEEYGINHIIYAIPAADAKNRKEILSICKEAGCKLQALPGIYQLVNGDVSVKKLKDVEIQDLLGREQIRVNNEEILKTIKGKTVLVTGGGGSIGSELCRQIAKSEPELLVIFEIYENSAFEIRQELLKNNPNLNLETLIGSVRNARRIEFVMAEYSPDLVFHAAAHKHVPLMEDSPNEAIKNNVIGTYKTAMAAAKAGVEKFVLISTDKAVNPTNIMGASKRLCEMVVQMMNRKYDTDFVAVRFGNVLGSNGSVIPLFKKQIAEGGPVTVTHKDITRFFMTIPEAVSLVLQASYYAKNGEIFVFDMGEPVKIDFLARNMIQLSGYTPDVDIVIEYTGLRPGEKLYEELLMGEEGLEKTDNELIFIGAPLEMDDEIFEKQLKELEEASENESDRIKEIVAEVVPTYQYRK